MKSTKDILVEAYLTGHAWNPDPEYANLRNLDPGRVAMMDGSEADAKLLVRSRQLSDSNYDLLVQSYLKRFPDYDGGIGPATQALVSLPRCAMPDYAPPPGASFHYDNPELQAAVISYQEFAEYKGGSGSWPKGCDPEWPNVHSVRVCLNDSAASSSQKTILDDVLRYVEETEAEMGQHVRHIRNGDPKQAEHDVRFQNIPGGVIGFAYFPSPNNCNQNVTARIDNTFNARLAVLAELLTHEYKGHSDGLEHTRGGIMNPSIGSPTTRATWISDPHQSTKTRYFGGVPVGPPVTTTTTRNPNDPPQPTLTIQLPIQPFKDANGRLFTIRPYEPV
jgi:hypothetical protein